MRDIYFTLYVHSVISKGAEECAAAHHPSNKMFPKDKGIENAKNMLLNTEE